MGEIARMRPLELDALTKKMAESGYCAGTTFQNKLDSARRLLTGVIVPYLTPLPSPAVPLTEAPATKPDKAFRCRACHKEGVRFRNRGIPEGWFRVCVGESEQERSAGVVCSPECLRKAVDQVLAEPTERPDIPERHFFCAACRNETMALTPPAGWLSVRRHTAAGRFHPAGIYCGPRCLAQRLEPSVKAKKPAKVTPPVQSSPPPPKTSAASMRTCAVCFATFAAGEAKCPRGHRVGGIVAR